MKKEIKVKIPGRVKLVCINCGKEFTTHSTNREKCYRCLPKCTEIHYFNQPLGDSNSKF